MSQRAPLSSVATGRKSSWSARKETFARQRGGKIGATAALAVEISAIRLQLKRLAADQQVAARELWQRATDT
jgi:hypothetical protein